MVRLLDRYNKTDIIKQILQNRSNKYIQQNRSNKYIQQNRYNKTIRERSERTNKNINHQTDTIK